MNKIYYQEPLEEYTDMELKQALNRWMLEQSVPVQYHPGHKYDEPVDISLPEYAFYMGQFFMEAFNRGLQNIGVTDIPVALRSALSKEAMI